MHITKSHYSLSKLSPKRCLQIAWETASIIDKLNIPFTAQSSDKELSNFFRKNTKRYGKRDRFFLREAAYAFIRNKRKAEHLTEKLASDLNAERKTQMTVLYSLYLSGAIERNACKKALAILNIIDDNFELNANKCPHTSTDIGYEYSYPNWLVEKWIDYYGNDKAIKLCKFLNSKAPIDIRVNLSKTTKENICQMLSKNGIDHAPIKNNPAGIRIKSNCDLKKTDEYINGLFEVQDHGSQMLSFLIDTSNVSKIWDACCGAGGKSLHISDLLNNKVKMFASDINNRRLNEFYKRSERAQANITIFKPTNHNLKEIQQERPDILIIDAPCSSTGRLRRSPEIKWKLSKADVLKQAKYNKDLVLGLSKYVDKNCLIYYMTCSLEPEENELLVNDLLSDFEFEPHTLFKKDVHQLHIDPVRYDSDGFFIACFKKKC